MTSSAPSSSFHTNADTRLARFLLAAVACSVALVVLIAGFLLQESWPALRQGGWRSFVDGRAGWFPTSGEFNLWPMALASILAAVGALLTAVPLGVGAAIFLRFHAPGWLAQPFRHLVLLLAGIPSVVFGLWGLTVLVPLVARWAPPGASLLTAALILALMVLPTVALTAETSLAAVPQSLLHGAQALGLGRRATVLRVALPAARAGILSGILLAAARVLGETMAVMMVAGNVVQVPDSLFAPVRTLTANIALEMAYATGTHRASLFVSGLLLTAVVAVLAWLAARAEGARHV